MPSLPDSGSEAWVLPATPTEHVVKIEDGQETVLLLRYGAEPNHLPGREEKLLLVVVAGWG